MPWSTFPFCRSAFAWPTVSMITKPFAVAAGTPRSRRMGRRSESMTQMHLKYGI